MALIQPTGPQAAQEPLGPSDLGDAELLNGFERKESTIKVIFLRAKSGGPGQLYCSCWRVPKSPLGAWQNRF